MSDADKHRARIFLHRGQLAQAKAAYEQAVSDDRLANDHRRSLRFARQSGQRLRPIGRPGSRRSLLQGSAHDPAHGTESARHRPHPCEPRQSVTSEPAHRKRPAPTISKPSISCTPLDDYRALGILYHNLGMEEARRAQWDEATAYFTQALDAHRIVGNEEGLALTYSQLGKAFLDAGDLRKAENCFNNASEHFIKLGNAPGEAAVLRLLADVYIHVADRVSAIRCLERVVFLATHYKLPELNRWTWKLEPIRLPAPRP